MIGVLIALMACSSGPYQAPYGSTATVDPSSLSFSEGCRYGFCRGSCSIDDYDSIGEYLNDCDPVDGYGELTFFTATVLSNGAPLNNASVTIYSSSPTIYLIPEAAVQVVDGAQINCLADRTQDGCDAYFYDGAGQVYFQIANSYLAPTDTGGAAFMPTYMKGATDRWGSLDFYVFTDEAPAPGDTSSIHVDIGAAGAVVEIATGSSG